MYELVIKRQGLGVEVGRSFRMKGQSVCQHAHGGSFSAERMVSCRFIVLISQKPQMTDERKVTDAMAQLCNDHTMHVPSGHDTE